MPIMPALRTTLFQEVAQCLMRLVEAKSAADSVDALAGFFEALPVAWHTVDLFEGGRTRRRVLSRRCPRGFATFVTRLGFFKRQDGTYPGSFAGSTVVLVKVGNPGISDQCLVAGLGLAKNSALNDGAVIACVGALIHEALSRVWLFELEARRGDMLNAFFDGTEEFAVLFDSHGSHVAQHPADQDTSGFTKLFLTAAAHRRRSASVFAVVAPDGRSYSAHARWITGGRPLEEKYLLVLAKARSSMLAPVAERLKSYGLSRRESQVAELVFTGKTNRRIADTLFISRDTVKTHCRHIFGKLGISRRTEFLSVMGVSAIPPLADSEQP
jgi:DNA-binding CsgD family transcriptional regulator